MFLSLSTGSVRHSPHSLANGPTVRPSKPFHRCGVPPPKKITNGTQLSILVRSARRPWEDPLLHSIPSPDGLESRCAPASKRMDLRQRANGTAMEPTRADIYIYMYIMLSYMFILTLWGSCRHFSRVEPSSASRYRCCAKRFCSDITYCNI